MQLQKGQSVTVEIEKLAFGGRGIGELEDGRKVFVEGVVPGDRVEASLTKIKKGYAEASLVSVIKKSGLRCDSRCKHFPRCGGCKWQMIPYAEQLKFKEEQVREALEHIGGFENPNVEPIIGCESEWFYRNKMEFSFGDESKEDMEVRVGLHPGGRFFDVFDVEECFLLSEKVSELLERIRGFVRKHGFEKDFLDSFVVREGKKTGDMMVNLVTTGDFQQTDEFAEMFKDMTSVYWSFIRRKRGMPTQRTEHLLAGKPVIRDRIGDLEFKISPQAFFQPNTNQAEVLYEKALELAGLTGDEIVFDLYCGTGTIGLYCAKHARKVYGLELNESATENARQNAMLNGIDNAEFLCGDVYENILKIPATPDVVIMDPPRSGVGEKALQKVVDFEPKKIVYVSCNPSTFARDCKFLAENGFNLKTTVPVDMLPHTYHIETVGILLKY